MSSERLRILDSDTLSLIQRGRQAAVSRLLGTPVAQRAITIVTVEEQLRGRLADVRRAREGTPLFAMAYVRLQQTVEAFRDILVLPMDGAAVEHLAALRAQRLRLSTHDLRIAAITLCVGGVLVTCNTTHFSQVRGLDLEDWTQT